MKSFGLTIAVGPDGELVHVDETSSWSKEARNSCRCWDCGGLLTPKPYGKKKAHHFFHQSLANCYATGGEGHLHLSAKLWLVLQLRLAAQVKATLRLLKTCNRCGAQMEAPFVTLAPSDTVEPERRLERRRPDVLIHRGETPFLALEVLVSHACDEQKWTELGLSGTTAVEIAASNITGGPPTESWRYDRALPVLQVRPDRRPHCAACEQSGRAAETAEIEPIALCDLDHFGQNGSLNRYRLYLDAATQDRQRISASLTVERVGSRHPQVIDQWSGVEIRDTETLLGKVRGAARRWAKQFPSAEVDTYGGFRLDSFDPNGDRPLAARRWDVLMERWIRRDALCSLGELHERYGVVLKKALGKGKIHTVLVSPFAKASVTQEMVIIAEAERVLGRT
jgi:hypothetical protein